MMACVPTCPFSEGSFTVRVLVYYPAMQSYFHHNNFRPGQLEAMLPIMHGKDVLVKMPTGGGKTMCMFVPPLATRYGHGFGDQSLDRLNGAASKILSYF